MSNELLDEHEQGERVKQWIRENGPAIVIGVGLGLGGLFGWRYWDTHQAQERIEAARTYQTLVTSLEQDDEAAAQSALATLEAKKHEAYQGMAALRLAQEAVEERNIEEAARLYRLAAAKGEPKAVRAIAGLRLARVQLQNGQLQEALATVQKHEADGYRGVASEIRGDILLAMGDRSGARAAYQEALENLGPGGGDRALLQMKLDDLAEPPLVSEGDETS